MPAPRRSTRLRPNERRVVSITRVFDTSRGTPGIVRQVRKEWALVQVVDDLRLDGWECIRLADVVAVTRGSSERFAERVLRKEGVLGSPAPAQVTLNDVVTFVRTLLPLPVLALECEGDSDFLLGKPLRATSRHVVVHEVDGGGVWLRRSTRVQLSDITRVQFGDDYGRMFERYAPRARQSPARIVDRKLARARWAGGTRDERRAQWPEA